MAELPRWSTENKCRDQETKISPCPGLRTHTAAPHLREASHWHPELVKKWLGKAPPGFLEIPSEELFVPTPAPTLPSLFPLLLPFPSSSSNFQTSGGKLPPAMPPILEGQMSSLTGSRRSGRCQNTSAYSSHQPGSSCLIPKNLPKGEDPMHRKPPFLSKLPKLLPPTLWGEGTRGVWGRKDVSSLERLASAAKGPHMLRGLWPGMASTAWGQSWCMSSRE